MFESLWAAMVSVCAVETLAPNALSSPQKIMHVERFTNAQSVASWRSAWNGMAGGVPFRTFEWLMSWWRRYADDCPLYLLGVFDGDRLVGMAPFYRSAGKTGGRTLRFLGDGEVCSDYLDLLAAPGYENRIISPLVDWLLEALTTSDSWDAMELDGIESGTPLVEELTRQLAGAQAMVRRRPAQNCWRLELPESWYEFEMLQSKSHRKQIRRLIKRVFDTDRCQLHVCNSITQIDEAMPILIDLHTRRRKTLDQTGCFACDRFRRFLYEAANEMIPSGNCEILWLELDGAPIAAEIHFPTDTICYAYQAGIDPARIKEEPGSLMQIAVIRRAIEQGKTAVDFLRGDEPYKAHWRAEPRVCETIRVVPNTTSGLIRHGIWSTQVQVKSWFKASLGKD